MLDEKVIKVGTHIVSRGATSNYFLSSVIDSELGNGSEFSIKSTDKRYEEKNYNLSADHPKHFEIPVKALEGKMSPDALKIYLKKSTNFGPSGKYMIAGRDVLIMNIMDQFEEIKANYHPSE